MDSWIFILVLIGLSFPVMMIVTCAMTWGQRARIINLSRRLADAEKRIASLETNPQPDPVIAASEETVEQPVVSEPQSEPRPAWRIPAVTGGSSDGRDDNPSLEEKLGTRWAVWAGGIALALGGLFLVRYTVELGILGPLGRLVAGLLFSGALLATGEWMRRHDIQLSINRIPSAYIPGVLTAAGVSSAFATIYAAYALYGILPSGLALILLGGLSVATMVASALHGPALAGFGLVAAFATPLLVSGSRPNGWVILVYIGFVSAAAYALARLRDWHWLARASAGGGIFWALLLTTISWRNLPPAMLHVLVQIGLIGFFLVIDRYRHNRNEPRINWDTTGFLIAFGAIGILMATSSYAAPHPVFASVLIAMLLGLGLRYGPVTPSVAAAGLVCVGTIACWPFTGASRFYTGFYPYLPSGTPQSLATYLGFALSLPMVISAGCLYRLQQERPPFRLSAWLAGTAAVTPVLALILTYWRVARLETSLSFALLAGLLAAAFAAATVWLHRNERDETIRLGMSATASAALAALAAGLTFALEQGSLTVSLALTALGAAWVARKISVPALRYAVAAIGVLVLARVLANPTLTASDAGWTLFNWYLWSYGVPALAFFGASRLLERDGRDDVVRFLEGLTILFFSLTAFFEIRYAIHGRDVLDADFGHLEMGLFATVGISVSILMTRLNSLRPDPIYHGASLLFGGVSLLISGIGLAFIHNPYFTNEPIAGGAIFNSLIPAYLLPAGLAGFAAVKARGIRPSWYVMWAGVLALGLHLIYTLLEIRRLFQGQFIGLELPMSQAELGTYSFALLMIGLALLAVGLIFKSRFARLASGAYVMAAVFKVFVIDLANLHGMARALSFIALGLVLVGIGIAYQRLILQRRFSHG